MTVARFSEFDTAALDGRVPVVADLAKRPVDSAKRVVASIVLVVAAVALLIGAGASLVRWLGPPAAEAPGHAAGLRTQAMMATIGLGAIGLVAAIAAWWLIGERLRQIRRIHRLYRFAVANRLEFVASWTGTHLAGPAFEVSGNRREHSPFVRGRVGGAEFELGEYVVTHVASTRKADGGTRTTETPRTRFAYLSVDLGIPLPTVRLHSRRAPRVRRVRDLPRRRVDSGLERAFDVRGDEHRLDRVAAPPLRDALLAHADRHHVELHGTRVTLLTRNGASGDEERLEALLAAGDAIVPAVRAAFAPR